MSIWPFRDKVRTSPEYLTLNKNERIEVEVWAHKQHTAIDWFWECTGAVLGVATGLALHIILNRPPSLDMIGIGVAFGAIFAREARIAHYVRIRLHSYPQEKENRDCSAFDKW
jgi:hypothetical protein